MAHRITSRNKVLVARSLHPQYREVVRTYIKNLGIEAVEVGFGPDGRIDAAELGRALDDKTAAVVYQSPNFFGVVEDVKALSDAAHGAKALSVAVVAEALSLGSPRIAREARGRHRHRRGPVVRHPGELRRALSRLHGLQEGIPAADARTDHRPDGRQGRPAGLRPDAVHPRAAHPPRAGHLEHLLQPGPVRPAGDDLPGDPGQAGAAGDGLAERPESGLCRRQARPRSGA